jgi:signal transduction histidine kinase/CheY-like chemotaxis protein/GGDEF domain-containing protein
VIIELTNAPRLPKSPILIRILVPTVLVIIILVVFINIFLHASGTIRALNENAVDILTKNVQTRGYDLERLMVHYWSNLDKLEYDVISVLETYLEQENITINQFLGNSVREIELLGTLSANLIDAFHVSAATGIFIYFLNSDGPTEETHRLNGLYFRNLSHLVGIHANLILLRGHVDIARRHNISQDSLWDEYFTFDPNNVEKWRGFAYPQTNNASYWNGPHVFNPFPRDDANLQITYNRPVFYDGRPVAIIGTDMQMSHLDRHFPARDLDTFNESGYMLLQHNAQNIREGGSFTGQIFRITGGFINRILGGYQSINVSKQNNDGTFTLAERTDVHGVYYPLRIYRANSPFAHEAWVLAAVSTERSLFEMSSNIIQTIMYGSILAIAIGGVLLYFAIQSVTIPIASIIKQLKESSGDTLITKKANVNAYEIDLLCDTINDMIKRRLIAERNIREERQRYLLALESSSDTFIEYDIASDVFTIYYFTASPRHTPEIKTLNNFKSLATTFFHPEDSPAFFTLNSYESRIKTEFFDHIQNVASDRGYYWFFTNSILIQDENNKPQKIIGTAREITAKKIAERAEKDFARRDENTGFYKRQYGIERVQRKEPPYALSLININNFEKLEFTYGLIYGGIFIAQFADMLNQIVGDEGFAVRTGNDEFLICYDLTIAEAEEKAKMIYEEFDELYMGENADIRLSLSIDTLDDISLFKFSHYETPVAVNPNDKDNIANLALELYERTTHISNATQMLLGLIGRLFQLDRVVVSAYDVNFGTSQVTHDWHGEDISPPNRDIRKVPHRGFTKFAKILDNDTCTYSTENAPYNAITVLLCIPPGEAVSVYCCAISEQKKHTGGVLFMSTDPKKIWNENEQNQLHSVAKIITSYINVEKSRSASQAKSRFMSRVSHEIRTPMNAILGMTRIAKDAAEENNYTRVEDCLNKIDVSANYLLSLINDVLEISRIESGRILNIETKAFSLTTFIQTIEAVIRFAIEDNGITFNVVKNIRNDYVMGDDYRLKQVIINLLGNANKFTKPGGAITFMVEEREENHYRFSVRDTGIGIAHDKHRSIFNPFEQTDSPTGGQQGTGLGLSISRNIISAMDSTIELESEPGHGSEFSFTVVLPTAGKYQEEDTLTQTIDSKPLEGKRILAVDDIDINLEIVGYILEAAGIHIETAYSGYEAIDMFTKNPPGYYDAILMDIQMPGMDGITASREIRGNTNRSDAKTIPIIALTANAFDEDLKKSVESGMNEHISKPIDGKQLLSVLLSTIYTNEEE